MSTFDEARTKVRLSESTAENINNGDDHVGLDYDDVWDEKKFKQKFGIQIIRITRKTRKHARLGIELDSVDEIEFDMVGVDVAIANAIRRIMIAEVPTMAIEKVHIYENSSIIQDEVFAHRLGLIPIKADPHLFEYKQPGSSDEGTELDTLEFRLKVQCRKNLSASDSTDPNQLYINHKVTSKHLEWIPRGNQANQGKVGPVHDNILLAKLKPGQELDMRLFCVKGIHKDHAKFSPVALASYRLLPKITLMRPVYGEAAERLKKCFSPGVIELRDGENGKEAVVVNSRRDAMTREVFRHEDLKDAVKVERVQDNYIFCVESTGVMKSEQVVVEAMRVLQNKCLTLLQELEQDTKEKKMDTS